MNMPKEPQKDNPGSEPQQLKLIVITVGFLALGLMLYSFKPPQEFISAGLMALGGIGTLYLVISWGLRNSDTALEKKSLEAKLFRAKEDKFDSENKLKAAAEQLRLADSEISQLNAEIDTHRQCYEKKIKALEGEVATCSITEICGFDGLIQVAVSVGEEYGKEGKAYTVYTKSLNLPSLSKQIKIGARLHVLVEEVIDSIYGLPLVKLSANSTYIPEVLLKEKNVGKIVCCKRIAGVYSNVLATTRLTRASIEKTGKALQERIDVVIVSKRDLESCMTDENYKALFANEKKKKKRPRR
jgi:hypothetical protein